MPEITVPMLGKIEEDNRDKTGEYSPLYVSAIQDLDTFENWLKKGQPVNPANPTGLLAVPQTDKGGCTPDFLTIVGKEFKNFGDALQENYNEKHFDVIDVLASFTDYTAALNCVWTPSQQQPGIKCRIQFTDEDAFAQLVRLGHANLNTAYDLLDQIIVTDAAGGIAAGLGAHVQNAGNNPIRTGFSGIANVFTGVATIWASILSFVGLMFFAAGFTLAYFLPLIPFMKFFFNALSWVGSILEAIVMVPLIALAHINPKATGCRAPPPSPPISSSSIFSCGRF